LWLALDFLYPGLVRNWGAEHLMIGAPACGSWLTASPEAAGGWTLAAHGPRDIWEEIQSVTTRWRAAGEPSIYRLHLDDGHQQWVSGGVGTAELSWALPGADSMSAEEER
jgi:hypothetical protein